MEQAIQEYEEEVVPRGRDEVSCSVENGYMLHDWKKVQESPVFTRGFKPMDGHDGETKETFSEHAEVQKKREEEDRNVTVAAS